MTNVQAEKQVSLVELLSAVPADVRIGVDDGNDWKAGTTWHPVGRLCHDASVELRRLRAEILVYHDDRLRLSNEVDRLKAAQPTPVQEPVAWISHNAGLYHFKPDESLDPLPLYLAPPAAQLQWIGLTDESVVSAAARVLSDRVAASCNVDCGDMWMLHGNDSIEDARAMLEAAEAKLKEKNT